jgi:divalent metal cation (Fe/Co/Zn/Cd) transporter
MRPVNQEHLLKSGIRVSAIGASWTVVASTAGIVLGLTEGSLALVAFGAVGMLDVVGSITLVVHFVHARAHGAISDRLERLALRVVTAGLVAVGIATAAVSVMRLVEHSHGNGSAPGVVLASVSCVALTVFSLRKRHVAIRLPSDALLADSRLSAIGALLAVVAVGGTAATQALGWWWADPAAALLIAVIAGWLGVVMAQPPPNS